MASQTITPKNKTGSAKGGSDPRIGIAPAMKGSTLNKFSANPFKDGGAQEVKFNDNVTGGTSGPKLGKAPKAEPVTNKDATSAKY